MRGCHSVGRQTLELPTWTESDKFGDEKLPPADVPTNHEIINHHIIPQGIYIICNITLEYHEKNWKLDLKEQVENSADIAP